MKKKEFKREIGELKEIFAFLHEFTGRNGIQESTRYAMDLAVEELFTNMVKYNSGEKRKIAIDLRLSGKKFRVRLIDFSRKPYDMTQSPPVNIHQPLGERRVGGLGVHLTQKMIDEVSYRYSRGENRVTLIQYLEKQNEL